MTGLRIVDVLDESTFALLPPCADPRFDHCGCDYWENTTHGSKVARPDPPGATRQSWPAGSAAAPANPFMPDDPFMPAGRSGRPGHAAPSVSAASLFGPPGEDDPFSVPEWNPFAPSSASVRPSASVGPPKLRLLARGLRVFGSYAKVLLLDDVPAAYTQFGPLSAYPRAAMLRDLYPSLPQSPLPAIMTCIATTPEARGRGLARKLVEAVCADLAERGFSAVEAYPDESLPPDEASAATTSFWLACGFRVAAQAERYPVLRRELE